MHVSASTVGPALTTTATRDAVVARAPEGWRVLPLDVEPAGAQVV